MPTKITNLAEALKHQQIAENCPTQKLSTVIT